MKRKRSRRDLEKLVKKLDIGSSKPLNQEIIREILNLHPTKVNFKKTINRQDKNSTKIINHAPSDKLDIESKQLD